MFGEWVGSRQFVAWTLIFEGSLAVLVCVLGRFLGALPFERVQCGWQAIVHGVVATGPPILAFWWCIRSQWSPLRRLLLELEENVLPSFVACSLFDLAWFPLWLV